jgi:beta-galactosidase
MRSYLTCLLAFVLASEITVFAAKPLRTDTLLSTGWRTVLADTNAASTNGFEQVNCDDAAWSTVVVPHNWDDYNGLHRELHGNLHGTAWYRREFVVPPEKGERRVFLYFEGVGSYATVWVNGKLAGEHAGGRTTFTLDVTVLVDRAGTNLLAVRADHPAGIEDLPWVCGGCAQKVGFSEGSQPLGIFRPVHVVTTDPVRIEPFGVHVWNDETATAQSAVVHVTTDVRNYAQQVRHVMLQTRVLDQRGKTILTGKAKHSIPPGEIVEFRQDLPAMKRVKLWSIEDPYLYTLETTVLEGSKAIDQLRTFFGIRVVRWPAVDTNSPPGQFTLNGKPVFINGTCEYEHLLGNSHAFSDEQIRTRIAQVKATGFNSFRDAHQPHNLRYQEAWDQEGILWWPQMVAQIWFDNPRFRDNFKTLLRDWVRERRNSPSIVLWGIANESKLPADFARECVQIIRELDPTSPSQRLVTACNGGEGMDWNVPQNWTGTYGGDPKTYGEDVVRQRLIGEYGAWRSLGLHVEDALAQPKVHSENRFTELMEMKVRLAESVRDQTCGHYHWLLATHDNPGRKIGSSPGGSVGVMQTQGADGWGELNGIGPANNKGLLTLWGEPTDAFFMFRANYVPAATDPMVVIAGHGWPDRWTSPGVKSNIVVYSNCEEVELFNDHRRESLGVRRRGGPGTHFQWDDVAVRYNVLYAEGRIRGKTVARDAIVLTNLPAAPRRAALNGKDSGVMTPARGYHYLYRVNCGGPDYTDRKGNVWKADHDLTEGDVWGSVSWAAAYDNVPPRLGSQREIFDPIVGTRDEALFQTFRYGREKLAYLFAVPDGDYRVDLFFIEPWYGRGGGECTGWRLFDVAVNGETKLRDVDLWQEAGYARAIKKTISAKARGGWLEISFPRVASYQAVVSGIAIATADARAAVPAVPPAVPVSIQSRLRKLPSATQPAGMSESGFAVYPAVAARRQGAVVEGDIAVLTGTNASLTWDITVGLGGPHEMQLQLRNDGAAAVSVELAVASLDGATLATGTWTIPPGQGYVMSSPPEVFSFNAGTYAVTLSLRTNDTLHIKSLSVK